MVSTQGLVTVRRPLETVTCKMYVLRAWHWTRWSCRRMNFTILGLASRPNQTPAEQFNNPACLALAANIDPELPPDAFEMSHPESFPVCSGK